MIGCFAGFPVDEKVFLSIISISLAMSALVILRKANISTKSKIGLIYAHLTFLFFPFVLYATNFGCGVACMSCYSNLTGLVLYSLPTTLIVSTLAGLVVIPTSFMFYNRNGKSQNMEIRNFIRKYIKSMNLKMPRIYIVDKAKPIAFSFKSFTSAIFLSAGLIDILNKKELQAVILHELAHLKEKSSLLKVSTLIFKMFSPFSFVANFHKNTDKEEKKADDLAASVQKTDKYIKSARKKIEKFNKAEKTV